MLNDLEQDIDVICISETWLNDYSAFDYFSLKNYQCHFSNRKGKKGGGIAIFIKKGVDHYRVDNLCIIEENCMESMKIEILNEKAGKIIVSSIYRAPNTDIGLFNDKIEYLLKEVGNKKVYLCGDFNIDLLKTEMHAESTQFIESVWQGYNTTN